ncbi:MAG: UDP-N-acetylmuramate dehydrogenase [Spirochaetes bacterium]|nr:UDP-N-acetylmuramate dehydrogenase [Spirochaetota bacterium]
MKNIYKNGLFIKNLDLSRITSFKTGGKAKFYFIPDDLDSLKQILKHTSSRVFIIGNATNLLVSDKGFNGLIINLKGFTNYISRKNNCLIAGASVSLSSLIDYSIHNGLEGLEKLSGIPGTLGGALFMNAGAFGQEIGNVVDHVKVLSYKGQEKILFRKDIKFLYRRSEPLDKYIILEGVLRLSPGHKNALLKEHNRIIEQRWKKQPLDHPSAGSVFKRPEKGYAGEWIEKAGLKGFQKGQARVSEKHANFIINSGKARSQDIYDLITYIQNEVYNQFKIKLEPEIIFLGFKN